MVEKKKIIIIDDEKDFLKSLDKFLSEEELTIVACDTGRKGINRIKKESFDLILVDIIMPRMNGVELIRKTKEIDPKSRFLILTGYKITAEVEYFLKHDDAVCGYFQKPFDLNKLVEKIKEVLKEDS